MCFPTHLLLPQNQERLGKDSLGQYYECRLTLQPAVDPVCTPSGYLFSREAILENLLAQKKENKRKLALWEAQKAQATQKQTDMAAVEKEAELLAFDRQNHAGASTLLTSRLKDAITEEAAATMLGERKRTASGVINIKENAKRVKGVRAFWLPGRDEAEEVLDEPNNNTYCPASGAKLKLKDLITVKFTPATGETTTKNHQHAAVEYIDPVAMDAFTNASKLVCIKPTGDVVLLDTWKNVILPDGRYNGKAVGKGDVVELKTGGTGFSGRDGEAVEAKAHFHLGPGSRLTERRGQGGSGGSRFGLRIGN